MILVSIEAWNFMRFRHVALKNLPERGLFSIVGDNESGKSTLGHLFYYGLTGRPPRGYTTPVDLINWEAGQMKIEMSFTVRGVSHEVTRQCDRDGSEFTRLSAGGETLAKGGDEVYSKISQLLGYDSEWMNRAFLLDSGVMAELSRISPREHLEQMLNISRLDALNRSSTKRRADIHTQLEAAHKKIEELKAEQKEVGYSEAVERDLEKKMEEKASEKKGLDEKRDVLRSNQNELQRQSEHLEQEHEHLGGKIEEQNFPEIGGVVQQKIQHLQEIRLGGKPAEHLLRGVAVLKAVQAFLTDRKVLETLYENHLNNMRETLGLSQEDSTIQSDSLKKQEERSQNNIDRLRRSRNLCNILGLLLLMTLLVAAGIYVYREPVMAELRELEWLSSLKTGGVERVWNRVVEIFAPAKYGFPASPKAWLVLASVLSLDILLFLLAFSSQLRCRRAIVDHGVLLEKMRGLQEVYHQLLAADFKDLKEVADIIDRSHVPELQGALLTFRQQHPLLVAKNYDVFAGMRFARACLEEALQGAHLKMHQSREEIQASEELVAACQKEMSELSPRIDEAHAKREKYALLEKNVQDEERVNEERKREHRRLGCLGELSAGCHTAVLSRLRFHLTAMYKSLLTTVTAGRYSAVKFDEQFHLLVFSEDRGDFVPLANLSSGTHDLLVLLYQLLLVHGAMQAREIDAHTIFLDEPLQAVDAERYRHLCAQLPELSPHFRQIFLCRPPLDAKGAITIHTDLAKKDLEMDFKLG